MVSGFSVLIGLVTGGFAAISLGMLWNLQFTPRLPSLESLLPTAPDAEGEPTVRSSHTNGETAPEVSVIVAARDEGPRIEQTLRRLLAQEGVRLEIIAVDDRSKDDTTSVLKKLAGEDPRVVPMRIEVLPDGWLGKCHALHQGSLKARGSWYFFTDADCWLKRDGLRRALLVAEREGVQHVTLSPGVVPQTIWAEGWHLGFTLTVAGWIKRVNQDRPNAHLGAGAFNLVHAETYRAFGGHESLRLAVVDDVKLGYLVRKAGFRTRGYLGGDDAECHWGVTVREAIRLMEKNFFALMDYRVAVVWVAVGFIGFMCGFAVWAACWNRPWSWLPLAAWWSMAIPGRLAARKLGWGWAGACVLPLTFPVAYYALFRSMILTLKRGGIRWRDTFYPLEILKDANRQLNSARSSHR